MKAPIPPVREWPRLIEMKVCPKTGLSFEITEYDGYESIAEQGQVNWIIA